MLLTPWFLLCKDYIIYCFFLLPLSYEKKCICLFKYIVTDSINIKILNAGAWARGSERVTVSLPLELEDYIPEVEDFYKKKHSGRKLQWYHHMSNGTVIKILIFYLFYLLF